MSDCKSFCLECEYSNHVVVRKFYRFRFLAYLAGLCVRHDVDEVVYSYRPSVLSCVLFHPNGEIIRFFVERELTEVSDGD